MQYHLGPNLSPEGVVQFMPSANGRSKSYRTKHVLKVKQQIARSTPEAVRQRALSDQRRQTPWMPRPTNDLENQRQEYLLDCLLDPNIEKESSFILLWDRTCPWATGTRIQEFAHIFDRSVHGRWVVEAADDIDGEGNPGWLFSRA